MRVALATCSEFPRGVEEERPLAAILGAEFLCWDDPGADWQAYERVVIRSSWDYTSRPGQFLAWCAQLGPRRLRNRPELVAWNADKRYLAELSCPTVATVYIGPGEALPELSGDLVVKPNISGGARDTGLFSSASHDLARELIARIQSSGRTALVQPYIAEIAERGEQALVFFAGRLSHVLHKRAVLEPDEIAPTLGPEGPALAMLAEDLVVPGVCSATQLELADSLLGEVAERFGMPLYARVDLLEGPGGEPLVMELEAIEPRLYLHLSPGSAERFAAAIRDC